MATAQSSKTIEAILESIRGSHIDHREYRRAKEALFTHASFAGPGTVIILIGPSRTGKSRTARATRQRLAPHTMTDGQMPCIWTELVNPDRGRFSSKHLVLQLMTELKHPIYGEPEFDPNAKRPLFRPKTNSSEPILRGALEPALKARGTRWIFMDEAHHVTRTHSEFLTTSYLDSLKSIGNRTGVILIWVGGYELLSKAFFSAHLNGRIRIIHFPRYNNDVPEDLDEFHRVLAALDVNLPLPPGRSLLDIRSSIYDGAFGAVGSVITWSEAAVTQMVLEKSRYLLPKHFAATRHHIQLTGLKSEIILGEKRLEPMSIKADGTLEGELGDATPAEAQRRKPKAKAFQRKPVRDPIGPPK